MSCMESSSPVPSAAQSYLSLDRIPNDCAWSVINVSMEIFGPWSLLASADLSLVLPSALWIPLQSQSDPAISLQVQRRVPAKPREMGSNTRRGDKHCSKRSLTHHCFLQTFLFWLHLERGGDWGVGLLLLISTSFPYVVQNIKLFNVAEENSCCF